MSETDRCVDDAFDTDVVVVSAGPVGLTLGCADIMASTAPRTTMKHLGAALIANCGQKDTACMADVPSNFAWAARRIAVAC